MRNINRAHYGLKLFGADRDTLEIAQEVKIGVLRRITKEPKYAGLITDKYLQECIRIQMVIYKPITKESQTDFVNIQSRIGPSILFPLIIQDTTRLLITLEEWENRRYLAHNMSRVPQTSVIIHRDNRYPGFKIVTEENPICNLYTINIADITIIDAAETVTSRLLTTYPKITQIFNEY